MFIATIFFLFVFTASAAELTVRYYNQANVPEKAMREAVDTAGRAVKAAGLAVRWLDCTAFVAGCEGEAAGGKAVEMMIDPAPAVLDTAFAMAYSLLPENGGGSYTKVLWNRVTRYASSYNLPIGPVLGYVMAHELGHLLLHTGAHSPNGIMKAVWVGAETHLLAGGRLSFQPHEAAAMRRRLGSR